MEHFYVREKKWRIKVPEKHSSTLIEQNIMVLNNFNHISFVLDSIELTRATNENQKFINNWMRGKRWVIVSVRDWMIWIVNSFDKQMCAHWQRDIVSHEPDLRQQPSHYVTNQEQQK